MQTQPNSRIVIVCYTTDGFLLLEKFGVVKKELGFPEGNIEPDTSSLIARAKQILSDFGYNVDDSKKWKYLGELKDNTDTLYCYGVDVSSFENSESIKLVPLSEITHMNNTVVLACFFK